MPGPRALGPRLVAFEQRLVRGGLVVLPGPTDDDKTLRILRFQYNPETITRNRTGEWDANKQRERTPARTQGGQAQGGQRGAGLFAKSETISMKLVFDATEAILKADGAEAYEQGVLPELGVLETAALGGEAKERPARQSGVANTDAHPKEMLLVLGTRYFPVVITSLTITERRFTPDLVPVRAEVDVQMRVIEAREVQGNAFVKGAFDNLIAERMRNADLAWSVGPTVNTAESPFSEAGSATAASSGLLSAIRTALAVEPDPFGFDPFAAGGS